MRWNHRASKPLHLWFTIFLMPRSQLTNEAAQHFAHEWIDAWNAHDLERIIAHYAVDVVLISPMAAKLLPDSGGQICGIAALRRYFARGLEAFPKLRFQLIDVSAGPGTLVLLYRNHNDATVSEFMEIDPVGKVKRVLATYS